MGRLAGAERLALCHQVQVSKQKVLEGGNVHNGNCKMCVQEL